MPKGRKAPPSECPRCGARSPGPLRTWTLVSPIPDKEGRVTVTVMGAFLCPECGNTWNAVIQKLKAGGSEGSGERAGGESGEPQVIEIDVDELRER
ncbi:MAG: chromatin protein Cren7 [Acidilobaceae archaeon]